MKACIYSVLENKSLSSRYLFCFLGAAILQSLLSPLGATASFFPFLFIFVIMMLDLSFYIKWRRIYLFCMLLLCTLALGLHGILTAKDLFFPFLGIVCISSLSERVFILPELIYKYFLFVIIPTSIINWAMGNPVSWIPNSNMSMNIYGMGTKHGTAIVGYALFLASSSNLYYKNKINLSYKAMKVDLFFWLLSFYLVFFSTSRSVFMCQLGVCLLFFINIHRMRKQTSIVVSALLIVSVFFLEYLSDFVPYLSKNELISSFIHTDNFEQYGVTSGRSWLWGYHLSEFANSKWFLGGGREVVDFSVGDWVASLGMEAKAGGESYYTGVLACYGLMGIVLMLVHVVLFLYAVKRNNVVGMCVIFAAVYVTTTGVDLVSARSTFSIMLLAFYFSSFKLTNLYAKYGSQLYSSSYFKAITYVSSRT